MVYKLFQVVNQHQMPENSENKNPVKELSASEQERLRTEKRAEYIEKGLNPYPARFKREKKISEILSEFFSEEDSVREAVISTAGRVVAKRPMGKAAFLTIASEGAKIQIYSNNKLLSEEEHYLLKNIDIGDITGVKGETFRTKTGEPSIRASELSILSKSLLPLPVVKEKDGQVFDAFADVETRYRKRYLDLNVNDHVRQLFIKRSQILTEIRNFFNRRGFLEVETPMMQAVASGAAARPFETYHNALGIPLYLRIAPELYLKRLIVGGFEKVYELNRNFRNEGISTKHNPEFTMMEVYQAYADYEDMMQMTEDLFLHLADTVAGRRQLIYGDKTISLEKPWARKTYLGIIKEKTGLDFEPFLDTDLPDAEKAREMATGLGIKTDGIDSFWDVVDEIFSEKVEPELIQPVFITHFPKAISPLAKETEDNPLLVERFEPYITGREMGNAFSELNDPVEQQLRFKNQLTMKEEGAHETIEMDEDFIEALKTGMPPTGGLGIGIDRLVMLFTDSQSIKDVILFPLLRPKE